MPRDARPLVGLAWRPAIAPWIVSGLERFDVLEITVDHYFSGGPAQRAAIEGLRGRIPLFAHGVGLSLGTDAALDHAYLDRVGALIDRLGIPVYSEHLAFTRVPGRDLANLLPLPKTVPVAERVIARVLEVQARTGVPLLLENITYLFDWPDSAMSDAEFFTLICRETGAGVLLDVENLHINAANHGFDPLRFVDGLPAGAVEALHVAGGGTVDGVLVDTHDHPVRDGMMALLDAVLARHAPGIIVVERDRRLEAHDEIADDVARVRARARRMTAEAGHG